jgi:hypothetical protein
LRQATPQQGLVILDRALTVVQVWPFRLLKISLVAIVLTLLATAAREPGELQLPMPRIVEELCERVLDNAVAQFG